MKRALLTALIATAALIVYACGGGGSDAPTVPTPRVDCKAKPETCK